MVTTKRESERTCMGIADDAKRTGLVDRAWLTGSVTKVR